MTRQTLCRLLACVALGVALCAPVRAANYFVDRANGNDANDGLSWVTARATVGSALASAGSVAGPDTISVAAGDYIEQLIVPPDVTLLGGFPRGGGVRDPVANVTILDGNYAAAPVVTFPPGSDGTVLDGFDVRRGRDYSGIAPVGGVLVQDSDALIQGNVIEDNITCDCGGVAVVDSVVRPAARLVNNRITRNGVAHLHACFGLGGLTEMGAGLCINAPLSLDLGVITSGNVLAGNRFSDAAVVFHGQGSMEHDVITDNGSGASLIGGPIRLFDVEVVRSQAAGATLDCAGSYRFDNVTLAENHSGIATAGGSTGGGDLHVESSILWSDAGEIAWSCPGPAPVVVSSDVQGGFTGGTAIIDADPLFVTGPEGDFYLSQAAAGQPVTSPAVDAGSQTALAAGLDLRTTATNSVADAGTVDLGYHAPRVATLTILRGTVANGLAPYRTVAALPFTDVPGSLSDPTLPLLFYRVPEASNDIGVTKDTATDAVVLSFR